MDESTDVSSVNRIRQLRLVVHASDYEQAVHFFRDVLGAPVAEEYARPASS